MAGESLNLPHNGVILTHSSKGPDLSLRGQSNGKWAYLPRSNVIRLNFCFYFQLSFNLSMTFPFPPAVAVDSMAAYSEMQRIQHTAVNLYVQRTGDIGQGCSWGSAACLARWCTIIRNCLLPKSSKAGKALKMSHDRCRHRQQPQWRKLHRSIKLSCKVSMRPSE